MPDFSFGYLGIILFMVATGAGLPLPEEVAIVTAGILSAQGQLNPWLAFGACLVGALAGDCLMYWLGRHFGRRVLKERHWWNRFFHPEREAQIEQMLQKHDFKVLFLARFLVGLRSPVYLASGILRLPFRRFLMIDLVCATIVIATFFGLSYFLSHRFGDAIYGWIRRAEWSVTAVVIAVICGVSIYYWRRHRRKLAMQAVAEALDDDSDSDDPPDGSVEKAENVA